MAAHSSTLAWKIPWMEEPGGLQSMGSRRVGHDWATSLSLFPFMHWRRKWQPTPLFSPGESQGRGSLVGCRLWGRRVGHDWSDSAAAAGTVVNTLNISLLEILPTTLWRRCHYSQWHEKRSNGPALQNLDTELNWQQMQREMPFQRWGCFCWKSSGWLAQTEEF